MKRMRTNVIARIDVEAKILLHNTNPLQMENEEGTTACAKRKILAVGC